MKGNTIQEMEKELGIGSNFPKQKEEESPPLDAEVQKTFRGSRFFGRFSSAKSRRIPEIR
jgi:hypothetical protein